MNRILTVLSLFVSVALHGCSTLDEAVCVDASHEFKEISSIEPRYPHVAFEEGVEGWVEIELSITPDGRPDNIRIVGSEPHGIFDEGANAAAETIKFRPRVVNCEALRVDGVRIKYSFDIKKNPNSSNRTAAQ